MATAEPYWEALKFGFVSSISLPLGALLGIITRPSEHTVGLMMSFGGGSLLFAVSVEMFAASVREVEHDPEHGELLMCCTVGFSVLGASFYIMLNRLLSGSGAHTGAVSGSAHTGA